MKCAIFHSLCLELRRGRKNSSTDWDGKKIPEILETLLKPWSRWAKKKKLSNYNRAGLRCDSNGWRALEVERRILLESENKKFYSWKLFFTKRCYEYSKRFVKINYFLFASRFVLIFLFALCFFVFSQLRKLRVRPSTTTTTTSTD